MINITLSGNINIKSKNTTIERTGCQFYWDMIHSNNLPYDVFHKDEVVGKVVAFTWEPDKYSVDHVIICVDNVNSSFDISKISITPIGDWDLDEITSKSYVNVKGFNV